MFEPLIESAQPAVVIIATSILSAFLAESVSWLLVYNTEDYKIGKSGVASLTRQIEISKKKHKVAFMTLRAHLSLRTLLVALTASTQPLQYKPL
jgi:hypothetical protein